MGRSAHCRGRGAREGAATVSQPGCSERVPGARTMESSTERGARVAASREIANLKHTHVRRALVINRMKQQAHASAAAEQRARKANASKADQDAPQAPGRLARARRALGRARAWRGTHGCSRQHVCARAAAGRHGCEANASKADQLDHTRALRRRASCLARDAWPFKATGVHAAAGRRTRAKRMLPAVSTRLRERPRLGRAISAARGQGRVRACTQGLALGSKSRPGDGSG